MGYGGHVYDMISRIRQNQELKQRKHERFQKVADIQYDTTFKDPKYLLKKEKKLTTEELQEIRLKTKRSNRRQIIFQAVAIVISVSIIISLLLIFRK